MQPYYVHPSAIVETTELGEGSRVWAYAHVLSGARVGANCNLGDHSFVESGAVIGDNVTVKNHVCVWEGVILENDVFVGPFVAFTNDRHPRSPRMLEARERYAAKENWLVSTVVQQGATIGANATVLGDLRIGRYSLIGAGAVVTTDVPPFALMIGAPARQVGVVCRCGKQLADRRPAESCRECGMSIEFLTESIASEDYL